MTLNMLLCSTLHPFISPGGKQPATGEVWAVAVAPPTVHEQTGLLVAQPLRTQDAHMAGVADLDSEVSDNKTQHGSSEGNPTP